VFCGGNAEATPTRRKAVHIECPTCKSTHAERLVLTWAQGLSHQKSITASIGAIFDGDAIKRFFIGALALSFWPIGLPWMLITFVKPMVAISRTWGVSQTVLSAETKPPYRFRFWKYLLVGIALVVLAMSASATGPEFLKMVGINVEVATRSHESVGRDALLVGAVMLALVSVGLYFGVRYNRTVWPLVEARWQRSFKCGRCGTIYLVPGFDPVGVNKVVSYGRIGKGELLPRTHTEDQVKAVQAKAFDFDEVHVRKKGKGLLHQIGM